jgi:hypothetical protein
MSISVSVVILHNIALIRGDIIDKYMVDSDSSMVYLEKEWGSGYVVIQKHFQN